MSMGFGCGFLMCLMFAPGAVGLKGAWLPYGLGTGSSPSTDGMYALGRGSADVSTPLGSILDSSSSVNWKNGNSFNLSLLFL